MGKKSKSKEKIKQRFLIFVLFSLFLLMASLVHAAPSTPVCFFTAPGVCANVTPANPLPINLSGGGLASNLGTSTSGTNPRISGDTTSGFYTAGAGLVDVAISGSKIAEWLSTGYSVTGVMSVSGALTASTFNLLTLSAQTTGFIISGGTTSKTLTVPLDATVSGVNTGNVSLSGENYLILSGQSITVNAVNLGGSNVTGVLVGANGGTGVANTGKTITLGGNLTTSGAFPSTFTMTGTTSVTFPTSGTLATTSGLTNISIGTTTTTANPQISGDSTSGLYTPTGSSVAITTGGSQRVLWNSTGESITGILSVSGISSFANGATGAPSIAFSSDPTTGFYWTSSHNINVTLNGTTSFAFGTGGVFYGNNAAGPQMASGASSATAPSLYPNRSDTKAGIGANAAGNVSIITNNSTVATENTRFDSSGLTLLSGTMILGTNSLTMTGSIASTGSRVTKGWFTDVDVTNAITGSVTGNAATATALQNARTIGGTSFNGTANITVASATGGFTITGGNLTVSAINIATDTTTGTQIATGSTQKLGFYGATPIVQPSGNVATALSNLGLVSTPTITATTNANLTGPITSVGNATSIAAQTGTGTTFVVQTSPSLITPALGVATGTSLAVGGGSIGTDVLEVTGTTTNNGSVIVASGSVGIGTATPLGLFHTYKATGENSNYIQVGDTSVAALRFKNASPSEWRTGIAVTGSPSYGVRDVTNSKNSFTIEQSTPTNALYLAATGNIGIGTGTPLASLDISQKTDALILPSGTTGQRPATSINGMLRYNTTATAAIEGYINNAWTALGTGSGTVTAVSIATANGFSGSSSGGATPALTIVAGAITPSSINGITISNSNTPTWTIGSSSGTPVVTASSPLVITAATGNITCPTCNTSSANVNSVSGDGALISNSVSTGAVTLTLTNATAKSLWGNTSSSLGAPSYVTSPVVSGTMTAGSHIPTSSSIPTDGYYLPSANISAIADRSLEAMSFTNPLSAVDYLAVSGAATASPAYPSISATGTDTNIGINLVTKGTGVLQVNGAQLATANLSDAVNKGSWTPALKFGGASTGLTYSTQTGTYNQIGKTVVAELDIRLSAVGSSTGAATITGLPVSSNDVGFCYAGYYTGATLITQGFGGYINGTTINIATQGASGISGLTNSNVTSSLVLIMTCTYIAS